MHFLLQLLLVSATEGVHFLWQLSASTSARACTSCGSSFGLCEGVHFLWQLLWLVLVLVRGHALLVAAPLVSAAVRTYSQKDVRARKIKDQKT